MGGDLTTSADGESWIPAGDCGADSDEPERLQFAAAVGGMARKPPKVHHPPSIGRDLTNDKTTHTHQHSYLYY